MNTALREHHHRPNWAALVAVSAVLCCTVAGCGSSSNAADEPRRSTSSPRASSTPAQRSPAEAVRTATRRLQQTTSIRVTLNVTAPGKEELLASADMAFKPFSMRREDVDVAGADETTGVADSRSKRVVDRVVYTRVDENAPWVKQGRSGPLEGGWDQLADRMLENPMGPSTPPAKIDGLRKTGTESLRNAETTRYRGTVTVAALRAELATVKDRTQRADRTRRIAKYEALGIKQFTLELWIDTDGLLRQYVMRGASPAGTFAMGLVYDGIDSGFSIDPPAPDQIVDAAADSGGSGG